MYCTEPPGWTRLTEAPEGMPLTCCPPMTFAIGSRALARHTRKGLPQLPPARTLQPVAARNDCPLGRLNRAASPLERCTCDTVVTPPSVVTVLRTSAPLARSLGFAWESGGVTFW